MKNSQQKQFYGEISSCSSIIDSKRAFKRPYAIDITKQNGCADNVQRQTLKLDISWWYSCHVCIKNHQSLYKNVTENISGVWTCAGAF